MVAGAADTAVKGFGPDADREPVVAYRVPESVVTLEASPTATKPDSTVAVGGGVGSPETDRAHSDRLWTIRSTRPTSVSLPVARSTMSLIFVCSK